MFHFPGEDQERALTQFAADVLPRLRDALELGVSPGAVQRDQPRGGPAGPAPGSLRKQLRERVEVAAHPAGVALR